MMVEQFLAIIATKDSFAAKQVSNELSQLEEDELQDLENTIVFFADNGVAIEKQVEAFMFLRREIFEHQLYLMKNDHYMYSTYAEVERAVYMNARYMDNYVCAFALSQELWYNHRNLNKWLHRRISACNGQRYLEVGPGHGKMFAYAVNNLPFSEYVAVDISQRSVDWTTAYVNWARQTDRQTDRQVKAYKLFYQIFFSLMKRKSSI